MATTSTLESLAFEEVRSSTDKPYTSTAFILHSLLGSGRHWRSFSHSLASFLSNSSSSEWRLVLVDLRNHGKSADIGGLDPPHDMFNMAKDLANLVKNEGWDWPDVVMGHSIGGKVALQFAQSCAGGDYGDSVSLPKQIWVLDSIPGVECSGNVKGQLEKVFETLQTLPSSFPSQKWLVDHMIELGFPKSLSEWIGSTLKKSGEQETWAFNLDGAVHMFNSIWETSYWSLLEHPPRGMEINMVVAENGEMWSKDMIQRLQSLDKKKGDDSEGIVSLHILPNSGHFVQEDNPEGLFQIVSPKIASLSASSNI